MPVYSYRALNASGKTVRGVVDADTPQKARQRLRGDGLHPIDVQATSVREAPLRSRAALRRSFRFRPNRLRLLSITTRQTSTLLSAGVPVVEALNTIQEQAEDEGFRHALALIREEVTSGESLANAMGRQTDYFPKDYIHLVRAGELSGALDQVMEKLADDLEVRQDRRARVAAALAYPAFMTLVGAMVLFFLLSFIIPTLTDLFQSLHAALPMPTRILLFVSGLLKGYWWGVLLVLAALVLALKHWLKKEKNYRRFENTVFHIPIAGNLWQRLLLAQAIRGLAVMVGGGVPLITALNVTAEAMGRSGFAEALRLAAEKVGQGRSLAEGLDASGLFPPLARRMVAVGESSGTLNAMLGRVARAYEKETDQVLSTLTSLVEPVIIIVMGLLVGFIVISVLLPIFDLSGLVG